MSRLNITMSSKFVMKLKEKAKDKGMNVSEYIRHILLVAWGE